MATRDSVTAEGRDVLPTLEESPEPVDERETTCLRMGSEGSGLAVVGVVMQRVGGTGRLWGSRSFGGRSAGTGGDDESG